MKPLKIAALGFAVLLAVVVVAAIYGVPAGFLANYAQDQAIRAGYRLRIDGNTTLALRPAPVLTLGGLTVSDAIRPTTGLNVSADGARVSQRPTTCALFPEPPAASRRPARPLPTGLQSRSRP